MNYYLVMIDTSIAPAKGFTKGIQNVYICLAPDEKTAKVMVLNTFRNNPQIIHSLVYAISATPLETITKLLNPNQALWSYVPMGGMRAPGQQKRIPTPESLLDPRTLNLKDPNPLSGPAIPDVRHIEHVKGVPSHAASIDGLPIVAAPKPIVFEEQVKRDAALYTKAPSSDPLAAVLGDPAQLERLRAFLSGGAIPPVTTTPKEDPEASLRHSDDGEYDDDLNALPKNLSPGSPSTDLPSKVTGPIPGLIEPDNETMRRLRSNIKQVNLEDIAE